MTETAQPTVADRVRRIVGDYFAVADESLTAECDLRDDLGADSLDLVDLEMRIEAEFAITVGETENRTATVGQLVAFVERQVG